MSRSGFAALAALVAVIAAACGASAAGSPSPSASGSPIATAGGARSPVPSAATPTAASSSPPATPSAATAAPVGSGDLSAVEDLCQFLPRTLGGRVLTAVLFTGPEFEAFPASVSDQMRALLRGLGREPRDLTMAIASDSLGGIDVTVTAFRVRDVQAEAFFEAYVPLIEAAFPDAAVNETVLGQKSVYDVSLDGKSVGTTFLYPRDDVLFIVTGTDLDLVDEAFRALP